MPLLLFEVSGEFSDEEVVLQRLHVMVVSALGPSGRHRAQMNCLLCDIVHGAEDGLVAGIELAISRDLLSVRPASSRVCVLDSSRESTGLA